MSIEFRCGNCHKLVRTADDAAGKLGKCPLCDAVMTIPARDGSQQSGAERPDGGGAPVPADTGVLVGEYADDDLSASGLRPHRGPLILTFGISSLVLALSTTFLGCGCCAFIGVGSAAAACGLGVPAVLLGRQDLRAMKAGEMDPRGRSLSTVGMVLGIVGIAVSFLIMLLVVIFIAMQFGFAFAPSSSP